MIPTAFSHPIEAALRGFGISASSVKLAAQAENVTFKVIGVDGNAYTLRFHRPGYHDIDELQAESLWTQALAEAGLNVPVALAAPDGRRYLPIEIADRGETRWVGLARWVEGEVLLPFVRNPDADPALLIALFRRLGALVAAMHNQACNWRPPVSFRRRSLDADGLVGPNPFWGPFWEHEMLTPDEAATFIRVRDRLHALLSAYGKQSCRFSVIHADLHPGNILINGDTLAAIDFDDVAFGWHMYDLAVVLHQCQDLPLFPQLCSAIIEGYRSARPVGEQDLRMIPIFLLTRGLAEIGWFADRPENTTPTEIRTIKDFVLNQCAAFERGQLLSECD